MSIYLILTDNPLPFKVLALPAYGDPFFDLFCLKFDGEGQPRIETTSLNALVFGLSIHFRL